MRADEVSPALRAVARTLRADAVTGEIVGNLRDADVRAILLKGPSIAAWLYADGTPRPYGDTDLLVAPEALAPASRVLYAAGFAEQPAVSSYTWFRRSDRSVVDLHDTLFGAEAPRKDVWSALSERTERMRVGGLDVEVLVVPARTLNVVLHAAQHASDGFQQPLGDLERALLHAEEKSWEEAARLASRLRATATFAAGLRLHPEGTRRADRMGLTTERRPFMMFLRTEDRPYVVTLERLAAAPSLGARLRFVARRLVPPPDYMRWRYPRLAGRGPLGLALAYTWRPLSIAPRLPAAVVSWRRAREASRR
jgi:hypothetical protein